MAIEAMFIPLSSSGIVAVNTSLNNTETRFGYATLTQAKSKTQRKSNAVTQCSVEGKRKTGFIFMQLK